MSYYTNSKNPYTNIIDRPYVLYSASQGGASSSSYILGTTDVTIPANPNYPPSESGASTSYFIFTRWDFYKTSTNSTQFYLYNETQSKVITVVDQDAVLSDYTGKFMGQGSEKRNVIECHVGTTSNQASDQISYKAVVTGSVFDAYEINNFEVDTFIINSTSMTVNSSGLNIANSLYLGSSLILKEGLKFSSSTLAGFCNFNFLNGNQIISNYTTNSNGLNFESFINSTSALSSTQYDNFYVFDSYLGQISTNSTLITVYPIDKIKPLVIFKNTGTTGMIIYANGGIKLSVQTLTSDINNANLNTAFGNSTNLGNGFIGFFTTGGAPQLALGNGTTVWYVVTSTAAIST